MTKNKKQETKKSKYTKLTKKVKEDVRALAKKKFIILKIDEIGITIGSILGIIFLPYLVGLWFFNNSKTTLEDFCRGIENSGGCGNSEIWGCGLLIIIGILISLGVIFFICWLFFKLIKEIIKSNWNKAYRKAEKELGVKTDKWGSWDSGWWKRYYKDKKKDE